jgi:hypothetical protein
VFARSQVCRLKPWCERLALLVALMAICARLRTEIGNWQTLLAATGTPLTVLRGTWSFRLIAGWARRRFPALFDGRPADPGFGRTLFVVTIIQITEATTLEAEGPPHASEGPRREGQNISAGAERAE